jgi:hypothetical protein
MTSVVGMDDRGRLEAAVEVLEAPAAPVRLELVEQLAGGPRCVPPVRRSPV